MGADVTYKDTKNVPLSNAYFASKGPRDMDMPLESYADADLPMILN